MKTSSAKAKGRRLQDWVVTEILKLWRQHLVDDDIRPAIMGESGEDVKMSPFAQEILRISIECKNQEKFSVLKWYNHAVKNSKDREPILVIKKNHIKPLVVMDASYFFELLRSTTTDYE